MRLTTKGRFAVMAMIDLALREGSAVPISLGGISDRLMISLSYLEQLFGKLRRNGLVVSTRGPGGGYALARKAEDINVAEVISAVDEAIDATGCAGQDHCMGEDTGRCMTHDLWVSLNTLILDFLNGVSLRQLADEQLAKGVSLEDKPPLRDKPSQPKVKPIKITAPNSVFALGNAFFSDKS